MDKCAIMVANAVIRRYHTRDPFEIIANRKVRMRDISRYKHLLGYYIYMNGIDVIGINGNATDSQQLSAAAHEVGHLFIDRKDARAGETFRDTYFYSVDNRRAERRANTFAADLLLPDDQVLESMCYSAFEAERTQLEARFPYRCSAEYRLRSYQDMLQNFYEGHPDIASTEEIARDANVETHLVDYKINILNEKGYKMPQLPELRSNFMKEIIIPMQR